MAGGRLWTSEEDRYLTENYVKLGRRACADHLKRPINGVKCRAYALDIQADVAWTEREDKLLIEKYPTIGRAGCTKLLPERSITSVGARGGFLGLTNNKCHAPTQDEIEVIRANYPQRGGRKICNQLLPHLTPNMISYLAEKLGVLQRNRKQWTDEENQFLKLNYSSKGKHWCAQKLPGRMPNATAFQARNLGLATDPSGEYFKDWQGRAAASKRGRSNPGSRELMKKMWREGRMTQPFHTSERRQMHSATMRAWHAKHGNPNKGKRLSDETKQKMSAASRRMWNDLVFRTKMMTPERREKRRRVSSENWARSGRANENAYSRCSQGRRADLGGTFFRSGWEANYARILNILKERTEISNWEFEPDVFRFEVVDGPRSYTPDFKIWLHQDDNPHYVEIKGRMDEKSKIKLQRMRDFYPAVPVRVIGAQDYKELQGEFSSRIKTWEFYSSRYSAKRKARES